MLLQLALLYMLPIRYAHRVHVIHVVQEGNITTLEALAIQAHDYGVDNLTLCEVNETSINNTVSLNCGVLTDDFSRTRDFLYQWVPIVTTVVCFISVVFNLIILASAKYIRKITPTVFFSLSLVAVNAYAAFICALGVIVNSYLPRTYGWDPNKCWALIIEIFRMTGLMSSSLHLVALAINHYVGILRPLHYASTVTRRRLTLVIISLWVFPFMLYFFLISQQPDNDFMTLSCSYTFMEHLPYRLTVSCLFFAPLIIMTILYIHIFVTVKRNHSGFLQGHKNQAGSQHIKRNVKAIITTLLILGTYIIGYLPATIFYAITCHECPLPLASMTNRTKITLAMITTTLVLVKCLSDPVIYTVRMPEVRNGLRRMWLTRCCGKYLPAGRRRTMNSLRSDTIPLNRRSLVEKTSQTSNGHKHLCARTSPTSPVAVLTTTVA